MLRQFMIGGAMLGLMAAPAFAAPGPGYESAEIAGVQAAHVTPDAAIQTAENAAHGRAVSFGLEKTAAVNAYEVTVAANGRLQTVQVNPQTGAVIGMVPARPDSLAQDGLPANEIGRAVQAPVTLMQAVQNAENQLHGPALEAGYTVRQGQFGIDVDIVRNGRAETVSVDPTSGQVATAMNNPAEQHENQLDNDTDQGGANDAD